ncbi:MAG: YfhO family protein [Myxococcota bacterium]|nr:YfhO family protein [Myxococcota bacterium]
MNSTHRRGLAFLAIALYGSLLWWLRLMPEPAVAGLGLGNADQHIDHLPMARYGFAAVRAGHWPLWNPYQLAGMPFFAVPHTALLYPGNIFYWVLDVPRAIEATTVLHLVFGGLCTYALGRQLAMRTSGATLAACVLIGSGVWMAMSGSLTLHRALTWLPATALAIERTLRGGRWGPLGIAAAMASQALLGATEFSVYNSYGAILYGAVRAFALRPETGLRIVSLRVAAAVLAAAAGIGLAAIQLVPSFELAGLSARRAGNVDLALARFPYYSLRQILGEILAVENRPALGLLAVVGLLIGPGPRGARSGWVYAVAVSVLGVTMALGGLLYELHFQTPIGALFRFTHKWLLLYAFGGALLAGFAVTRLETWSGGIGRVALAGVALAGAAVVLGLSGGTTLPLLVSAAALAAFALVPIRGVRIALVASLALFDLGLLLANPLPLTLRPIHRPDLADRRADFWRDVAEHVGNQRVYVSPALMTRPDLTFKQGMLRGVRVSEDYEPLASARYDHYFGAASGKSSRKTRRQASHTVHTYSGFHRLTAGARLDWLDWTATRLYIVSRNPKEDAFFQRAAARGDMSVWRTEPGFIVFERPSALPRAWVVSRAHAVADESEALRTLASPDFDARAEVVVEGLDTRTPPDPATAALPTARVEFDRDEPEHIELRIASDRSAWLVLADAWYPGWEARIDGREVPVLRANSLFRTVRIEAGESVVRFDFRPRSLRIGAALSAGSALGLAALIALWQRSGGSLPATKGTARAT